MRALPHPAGPDHSLTADDEVASSRSRALAVLLSGALAVATACAGDDRPDQTVTQQGPSSVVTDASGDTVPEPDTADDIVDPPASTGDGAATTAPPRSAGAGQETAPTTSASPVPAAGDVGSYAAYYLRSSESSSILVRVGRQAGAEARPSTLDHLGRVLGEVSGKTVDLSDEAVPGEGRSWTAADIRALADSGGPAQSRDRSVVHLFFLRGGFADSDTVLGVAVRSDVAAIFSDRVKEAAGVFGDAARIEDAVTLHEIGHLLGLVDLFLDTGRADPEHPGHSPNRRSVMYYAVESTLVGDLLAGGPPTDFDQADLDDLARIRQG